MVTVGNFDQEGVSDGNWVNLDVDIHLYESPILLVRVGNEVDSRNISKRSLVVGVDLVDLKSVLEQLSVHC